MLQEEAEEEEEEEEGEEAAEPDLSHSLSSQRRVGGARQLNLKCTTGALKCQEMIQRPIVIS